LGQGGAAALRQRIRRFDHAVTLPLVLPRSPRALRLVATALAHSGDLPVWIALLAAAWWRGGPSWQMRAWVTGAGLALLEVLVIGIKSLIRRQRPPGTDGLIYRKADPYSFPSGHAARAVLLILLALRLGPPSAFIAIVAWSPFMVLSRIAIGIHWVLDVAGGALLGALLTVAVLGGASALGITL